MALKVRHCVLCLVEEEMLPPAEGTGVSLLKSTDPILAPLGAPISFPIKMQDKPGPRGRAQGAGTAFTPQVPAPGSSVPTLSPACCQDTEKP